jgi:DNA repair exonuclease SbcCD ATPase subunit
MAEAGHQPRQEQEAKDERIRFLRQEIVRQLQEGKALQVQYQERLQQNKELMDLVQCLTGMSISGHMWQQFPGRDMQRDIVRDIARDMEIEMLEQKQQQLQQHFAHLDHAFKQLEETHVRFQAELCTLTQQFAQEDRAYDM